MRPLALQRHPVLCCIICAMGLGWYIAIQVTKVDLQRVRNVKAIMNKLMGRVGRIKQVGALPSSRRLFLCCRTHLQ